MRSRRHYQHFQSIDFDEVFLICFVTGCIQYVWSRLSQKMRKHSSIIHLVGCWSQRLSRNTIQKTNKWWTSYSISGLRIRVFCIGCYIYNIIRVQVGMPFANRVWHRAQLYTDLQTRVYGCSPSCHPPYNMALYCNLVEFREEDALGHSLLHHAWYVTAPPQLQTY